MQVDQINTDFMDLAQIALEHIADEDTRYQIIMLEREFQKHLDEVRK
ncbi:MAG: hypothetical protein ACE3JK_10530 [Sporolactobacillus sp.]